MQVFMLLQLFGGIRLGRSFLLDSPTPSGPKLTDSHYITIIDFLADEKRARQQLEQLATQLRNEITVVKQEVQIIKQNNDSCTLGDISLLKNETQHLSKSVYDLENVNSALVNDVFSLSQNYSSLQNEYNLLQDIQRELLQNISVLSLENSNVHTQLFAMNTTTSLFETQFNTFMHYQSGGQLDNITTLQSKVNDLNIQMTNARNQISSLMQNNEIRKQDFLALINENKKTKTKVEALEIENERSLNESSDCVLEIDKLSSVFNTTQLNQLIQNVHNFQKQVAFYSCGTSDANYRSSQVVKFTRETTVIGYSNSANFRSTGIFTTEVEGLYIVATTIMSSTSAAHYYIYKNNRSVAYVYIGDTTGSSKQFYTGSMVVAVQLNVGDTVHVQTAVAMEVSGSASCITITKIK